VEAHDGAGRVLWSVQRLASGRVRYTERPGLRREAPAEVALFELVRDHAGEVREVWHIDAEGRRTPARRGVHGLRREAGATDEVRLTLLGSSGQPVGSAPRWVLRSQDAAGRSEEAYFDAAGKPAAGPEGCPRWRWSPEGPRALRGAGFDAEGRPTLHKDGYHRCTARYDERGHQVEAAFFGLDGKPCLHKNGYHRFSDRYDEHGQPLEEAYFGLDGKPAARVDEGPFKGCARQTWESGGKGELRQCCYWVPDGKGGFALRRRADAADRTLEQAFFTPQGRPTLHKDGYHRWTKRYDEHGHWVEWLSFGLDGKPCLDKTGNHRWTARYDERGNTVEEAYFGLDGKPTARVDEGPLKGCARQTWEYDGQGKLRQRSYFVPDDKGGCALRRRADAANRTLEYAYFTSQGRPTLHQDGYHRWTNRYDERGHRVEGAYFGLDGKPCLHKNGHHRWTARYDERGRLTDTPVFDVAGKRLRCRILVEKVSRESLAARAGLREGDVLLRYSGKELTSAAHFRYLRGDEGTGGTPRKLEVLREGKILTVELSPGETGMTLVNNAVRVMRTSLGIPSACDRRRR
jgi:hypothetical protein